MSAAHHGTSPLSPRDSLGRTLSGADCAGYTYDMLISLKKIAAQHRQTELERLIEAAAMEAQALSKREPA